MAFLSRATSPTSSGATSISDGPTRTSTTSSARGRGVRCSARVAENLSLLGAFFAPLISLPFDDACAEHYGVLRASLAAAGRPIGPNDLLIAATALAHDLILVSHNVREFSRVANLKLEDWE